RGGFGRARAAGGWNSTGGGLVPIGLPGPVRLQRRDDRLSQWRGGADRSGPIGPSDVDGPDRRRREPARQGRGTDRSAGGNVPILGRAADRRPDLGLAFHGGLGAADRTLAGSAAPASQARVPRASARLFLTRKTKLNDI